MKEKFDGVIGKHNIKSKEGAKKSSAETLAGNLRKAVNGQIEAIAQKAVAFADGKKADLEKKAAAAAKELFEATKKRATASGANKAKLASQLKYW